MKQHRNEQAMQRSVRPRLIRRTESAHFYKTPSAVVEKHVNPFLSLEDKVQMSQVNRKSRAGILAQDADSLRCAKATQKGLACTGLVTQLRVENECLSFCKDHINYVIRNFINLVARAGLTPELNEYPGVAVTYDNQQDSEPILTLDWSSSGWTGLVADFDFNFPERFDQIFQLKRFACGDSSPGECVTREFNFQSSAWRTLQVSWQVENPLGAIELPILDNQTIVLQNQDTDESYFSLLIDNPGFVHPQVVADELRGFNCENVTKFGRECFGFLRDTDLNKGCVNYCDKHRARNLRNVLNMLTNNPVFGESQEHETFILSGEWMIFVVNNEQETELKVTSEDVRHHQKPAGELVVSNMDNLGSGVEFYLRKSEKSADRLIRLWVQSGEFVVKIVHFKESDEFVKLEVVAAEQDTD